MTSPAAHPPLTTYRSVFANGQFRVLYSTSLLYGLAFTFEILSLSVLVFTRTGSPLLAALAFGIGFLPQVVGGALIVSLADRWAPRTAITTGLLVRAAPGLAIGLLPQLPVAAMLAVVAAAAAVAPVFSAASAGLLPDLLDGDRYVVGRSILGLTSSATQIVGLGVGGVVLAVLAPRQLLLVAGAALVAAALAARLGLHHQPARAAAAGASGAGLLRPGVLRSSIAGNAVLLRDAEVRGLLLAQWLPAWFVTGAESLIVPYTAAIGRPAGAAGVLLAALPVGMLTGDLVVGRCLRPVTRERLAFPLAAVMGLPLLVFAVHPPLPVAATLLGLAGAGFGYELGIQQAFLDSLPTTLRGQGFGLNTTGLMGGQGLSTPVAGVVAAVLGVGPAMAVAGAATIVAALALRAHLLPRRASADEPELIRDPDRN
jgi:predicted MFS family arabinose efflux permease